MFGDEELIKIHKERGVQVANIILFCFSVIFIRLWYLQIYKGELYETMIQFIGGLRAGMGYCGAKDIDTQKGAKFVKITAAGMRESHPHNVTITKESPNYSR